MIQVSEKLIYKPTAALSAPLSDGGHTSSQASPSRYDEECVCESAHRRPTYRDKYHHDKYGSPRT